MSIRVLFLQLCCGGVGGRVADPGFSRLSWGCVRDFVIGLVGGAIGGQVLQRVWVGNAYASEIEIFLSTILGGSVGGALFVVVLGTLRKIIRKH